VDGEKKTRTLCRVCLKEASSVICYPCKHLCLCGCRLPAVCPVCAAPITDTVRIPAASRPPLPIQSPPAALGSAEFVSALLAHFARVSPGSQTITA
jgi:hypothetical protein